MRQPLTQFDKMGCGGVLAGPGGRNRPAGHGFLYVNGTFSTIDVPGSSFTEANGINNAGHIVGRFFDSKGNSHGFLDVNGTFSTIDVPGASFTGANGINDAGQIIGGFLDSKGNPHQGFINVNGTFGTIDVPGAQIIVVNGINDAGHIVGHLLTAKPGTRFRRRTAPSAPLMFPAVTNFTQPVSTTPGTSLEIPLDTVSSTSGAPLAPLMFPAPALLS